MGYPKLKTFRGYKEYVKQIWQCGDSVYVSLAFSMKNEYPLILRLSRDQDVYEYLAKGDDKDVSAKNIAPTIFTYLGITLEQLRRGRLAEDFMVTDHITPNGFVFFIQIANSGAIAGGRYFFYDEHKQDVRMAYNWERENVDGPNMRFITAGSQGPFPQHPVLVPNRVQNMLVDEGKFTDYRATALATSMVGQPVTFIVDTQNRVRIFFTRRSNKVFVRYTLLNERIDLVSAPVCSVCATEQRDLFLCEACDTRPFCKECGEKHIFLTHK